MGDDDKSKLSFRFLGRHLHEIISIGNGGGLGHGCHPAVFVTMLLTGQTISYKSRIDHFYLQAEIIIILPITLPRRKWRDAGQTVRVIPGAYLNGIFAPLRCSEQNRL